MPKQFDVIVGNPPYNGVDRSSVKKAGVYEPFLKSGFRAHYPFMAMERQLLKPGGKMLYVTPHKWLTEGSAKSLREEMFKDGKLAFLEVKPQPKEWTVQTHQIAVFIFEKGLKGHDESIFCTADGRFPNVNNDAQRSLLRKVLISHAGLPRVKLFYGCVNGSSEEKSLHFESDWYDYHKKHLPPVTKRHSFINTYRDRVADVTLARENGEKIVITSDYTNVPCKNIVGIIDAIPFNCKLVGVATKKGHVMAALLSSAVATVVWKSFFDSMHFVTALTGLLPDITSLLPDDPTEEDINNAFGLTPDEIRQVNELASTYGQDT